MQKKSEKRQEKELRTRVMPFLVVSIESHRKPLNLTVTQSLIHLGNQEILRGSIEVYIDNIGMELAKDLKIHNIEMLIKEKKYNLQVEDNNLGEGYNISEIIIRKDDSVNLLFNIFIKDSNENKLNNYEGDAILKFKFKYSDFFDNQYEQESIINICLENNPDLALEEAVTHESLSPNSTDNNYTIASLKVENKKIEVL